MSYMICVFVSFKQPDSPLNKAECMSATVDGQYIVIGMQTGLVVLSSDTGTIVDIWLDESLHITSVDTALLADGKHLITTIDDMGVYVS